MSAHLLAMATVFMACSGEDSTQTRDAEELEESSSRVVTHFVATSNDCDHDVGSNKCVVVAPNKVDSPTRVPRFVVDGVFDQKEWTGKTTLPFTSQGLFANGQIHLAVTEEQSSTFGGRPQTSHKLHLYLENIPVDKRPDPGTTVPSGPPATGLIRIYLDRERFTGADEFFAGEDRIYQFNIITGDEISLFSSKKIGGVSTWSKIAGKGGLELKTSTCKADPTDPNKILRCNAEIKIPLGAILPPKNSDIAAGFGLGITDVRARGGMPENVKNLLGDPSLLVEHRDRLQTIFLGRPRGFPLSYMSFNVHRFGSDLFQEDFDKVNEDQLGKFIAEQNSDIVAIQEGWDEEKVEAIRQAANKYRLAADPQAKEYQKYGPPRFTDAMDGIIQAAGGLVDGNTHGGVWIFSHLKPVAMGTHVYKAGEHCRGEDCFKAKGAQWVRFNLNPSTAANSACDLTSSMAGGEFDPATACPLPPSGDHYVDVFNTHLQAGKPKFCVDGALGQAKLAGLASTLSLLSNSSVAEIVAAYTLTHIVNVALNCYTSSDEEIRTAQLQELNDFIRRVTFEKQDRPAIIMGDFNLDGKTLTDPEYPNAMKTLRIGSTQPQNDKTPHNDVITPWPGLSGEEVVHGDVVRQRGEYDNPDVFNNLSGKLLTGTFITGDKKLDKNVVVSQDWMGNYMGNERFDYILLRPAIAWDDPLYKAPDWAVYTVPGKDIWSSPWPGQTGDFGPPPARLSDHKPVMSSLELVPLEYHPKYHATWKHQWELRTTSLDVSGLDDCWGDPDPRPEIYASRALQDGSIVSYPKVTGYECENVVAASWPSDDCTSNWHSAATHEPSTDVSHSGCAAMLEIDSGCGDNDWIALTQGKDIPCTTLTWNVDNTGFGVLKFPRFPSFTPWDADSARLMDNEPIGSCTGDGVAIACLRTSFAELPPGQQ